MIDEQNELLIQKCVDGELSVEAQQQLLAQLDILTEGWKVLALAYVEEQSWNASFSESNRLALQLENEAFTQSIDTLTNEAMFAGKGQAVQCFMPPGEADSDKRSRLLTQATCLAIALVGGTLIGDIWSSRSATTVTEITNKTKTGPSDNQGGNLSSGSEPVTVVRGQNGGVAAYPIDRFNRARMESESEFEEWIDRDLLRRSGLQIDQDQRWIFLELEDGRRALMPVESWNILPVGQ
jgi:hypothetical protein